MLSKFFFDNKLSLLIIHIVIGFLATLSGFPGIYGFGILLLCLILLFRTKNRNEEAFVLAAYITGAEVFVRMIKGFPTYETGKYAVIVLLLIGIFIGGVKQKFSIQYFFYLLLLLLGIVFTQVPEGESIRKAIIFNLSGPIVLGISALYFYKRKVTKEQMLNALFAMLLPLFSMVTYLYFRTPDLKEIVFGGSANFETSGGFGPNQVATAIGAGIFIITILILLKQKISGYIILDFFFLLYFIYRGLLTFSRGGIITGAIALVFFFFFYILYEKGSLKSFFKYIVIGGALISAIWVYTSDVTGGMLDNRYAGKNAKGVKKEDITSGRTAILGDQLKSFIETPLGIGVGNGKYKRQLQGENITAASHNELGRVIEEHGAIGLVLLILLLTTPLSNFFAGNNYQRAFIVAFYLFWFLTINHSAMRIAFPGFIYALSLINITNTKSE